MSNRGVSYESGERVRRRQKRRGHGCLIGFLALIVIVAIAGFAGYQMLRSMFDSIQSYEVDSDNLVTVNEDANMENYTNIALFGVDDQDNEIKSTGSRTDSIIVASINNETKEVKLMSIYRDTYVSIDGEYDKINAAHSYGGPELAMSTINRNLDLNITDFVTVNFKALADAVDIVGGVELTVQSETELNNLNDYIGNMNKINGGDSPTFDEPDSYPFTATFDGNQAVAYSRIRYMEGGDHARASHQRLVISGLVSKIKSKPWTIVSIINEVVPQCQTSLTSSQMISFCLSFAKAEISDSQAYPFDGYSEDIKYSGIYYGFPITAAYNTKLAHEYLFRTEDYEVSDELALISEKISWITEDFGYESPE